MSEEKEKQLIERSTQQFFNGFDKTSTEFVSFNALSFDTQEREREKEYRIKLTKHLKPKSKQFRLRIFLVVAFSFHSICVRVYLSESIVCYVFFSFPSSAIDLFICDWLIDWLVYKYIENDSDRLAQRRIIIIIIRNKKCLPGPINSIIKVNGTTTQKANIKRQPRRRRGDAVSPIFIVANIKYLQQKENKKEEKMNDKIVHNKCTRMSMYVKQKWICFITY